MKGVNRFGRTLLGAALCVGLSASPLASSYAEAQGKAPAAAAAKPPSKATREKARESYKKGEEKFGTGDFAAALEGYKGANALIPSAQAQFKIALTLDKMGKTAEAGDAYKAFLAAPPPEAMAEQKAAAEKRLAEMNQGSIKITTEPPGASILVDGERALDPSPATLPAKPGAHKVEVTLFGYEGTSRDVTVTAGAATDVKITLKQLPPEAPVAVASAPPPPPVASAPPPPPPPAEPRSKVPAIVTLSVGGVGAIVGTIFGLSALSAKSDFKNAPTSDNADKAERNALIADMSFGVALTLGITGTVLLLSSDKPVETPKAGALRFVPMLSRDTQGAAAQLRF